MRGKKAKELRALAAECGLPATHYVSEKKGTRIFHTGRFNADGKEQVFSITMLTVRLGTCTRQLYQTLKRV